jgi:hypothetical protein
MSIQISLHWPWEVLVNIPKTSCQLLNNFVIPSEIVLEALSVEKILPIQVISIQRSYNNCFDNVNTLVFDSISMEFYSRNWHLEDYT